MQLKEASLYSKAACPKLRLSTWLLRIRMRLYTCGMPMPAMTRQWLWSPVSVR